MGFAGEGEHAVLFQFEIGKKSVASNSAHYPEALHLSVPLREIHQFLEHCLDSKPFHEQTNFEAAFCPVLQDASFLDILDQLAAGVVKQLHCLQTGLHSCEILFFFKLDVLLFVEIVLEDAVFFLELQISGELALAQLGLVDFSQLLPQIPALPYQIDDDAVDPRTSAFLFETELVFLLVVGDAEDVSFLVQSVHFGDPQPLDRELVPGLIGLFFLAGSDAVGVAGEEARRPPRKRLFFAQRGPFFLEVMDHLLPHQARDDADEERYLRLAVHLLQGEPLELGQFLQKALLSGGAHDGGLEQQQFFQHFVGDGVAGEHLFEVLECGFEFSVGGGVHAIYGQIQTGDCVMLQYLISMASVIQALIQKYRPEIDKLQNWESTSDEKRAEAAKLQKLAEALMTLIVIDIVPCDRVATLSASILKKICNKLLEGESSSRKVRPEFLKKVLGKFVADELGSQSSLSGLREQFELIFEVEDLEQSGDWAAQSSVLQQDELEEYQAFLSNIPSQESTRSSLFESYSNERGLRYPAVADRSFETWGNDIHSMKVLSYLREISAPQTELTYLCQSMGWRLSFPEDSREGGFEVVAEVDFEFGKAQQQLQESFVAKNKKMGRVFASMKMLKKIYINFPQIWDMYEEKRKKKSLAIDKTMLNPLLFPAEVLNERVEPIASKAKDSELLRQKEAYLNNISSFKSEFNLLSQQQPGVFSLKVDKAQVGAKWQVRGEMAIKFKGREARKERVAERGSAKAAEEEVVKQLVIEAYELYPEILQMMVMIKNKKSIKT